MRRPHFRCGKAERSSKKRSTVVRGGGQRLSTVFGEEVRGSYITVVGTSRWAHVESESSITLVKEDGESKMVSQFTMELQGLKAMDGEDPPKILHFNLKIKGDWSG
ncbi:unnamed protein product [Fraxinus pennsylvanica]|uniref:Uncharacterized protein n=1 Tax=Fraxinus pennsylvanica TaxID=56036 RepID=A0AAD2A504_9LAMI|nr:unnamed protein product [Fraxinus pennsylvanica]